MSDTNYWSWTVHIFSLHITKKRKRNMCALIHTHTQKLLRNFHKWFYVSIYCTQYTWLLNLMDFSLQVTWEWYVNTHEKLKLPICIKILSLHRTPTSITRNRKIPLWHAKKPEDCQILISVWNVCLWPFFKESILTIEIVQPVMMNQRSPLGIPRHHF